jgi:hypothetical protein
MPPAPWTLLRRNKPSTLSKQGAGSKNRTRDSQDKHGLIRVWRQERVDSNRAEKTDVVTAYAEDETQVSRERSPQIDQRRETANWRHKHRG